MKITYDPEVDALYIQFRDTTVTTKHVDEDLSVDYDADGVVAGIELLNAKRLLKDESIFRAVVLEELAFAHAAS